MIAVVLPLSIIIQSASATQCARQSPEIYYERSDVIFVGSVVEIERSGRFLEEGHYVSLNVSKSWKGLDTKQVTLNSAGGRFRDIGSEHLVYADKNLLAIEVSFCGGTISTDSESFVYRDLAFLDGQPSIELKNGHTISMNPFPLLGMISLIAASGAAIFGVIEARISVGSLVRAFPAIAGLFIGIFLIWSLSNITFPSLIVCHARPLEHIEKLSQIPVMVPTILPDGYSFQGGEIAMGKSSFSLNYHTEPVCGRTHHLTVTDGVILVSGSPIQFYRIPENMTSAEYLDSLFSQYQQDPSEIEERYSFEDGREALAITAVIHPSKTTHVLIGDDKNRTWYEISTNRSAKEAVTIAESLKTIGD
jgi:hypothetical protein